MKTCHIVFSAAVLVCFSFSTIVLAVDVNGFWTKTTGPDPNNRSFFIKIKMN